MIDEGKAAEQMLAGLVQPCADAVQVCLIRANRK